MKDLIAAAQAKRKLAHSQNSIFGKLDPSFLGINDTQMRSHSPIMVQHASAAIVMPVPVQEHQQDSFPSNHEHQSSSGNQNETDDNEERRRSSGHESVGGSLSGGTEAAVSRDAFEGMIETLSRTKESIGRATRLAIDCAKYGIASEVRWSVGLYLCSVLRLSTNLVLGCTEKATFKLHFSPLSLLDV